MDLLLDELIEHGGERPPPRQSSRAAITVKPPPPDGSTRPEAGPNGATGHGQRWTVLVGIVIIVALLAVAIVTALR
jgi:hypothetical protein